MELKLWVAELTEVDDGRLRSSRLRASGMCPEDESTGVDACDKLRGDEGIPCSADIQSRKIASAPFAGEMWTSVDWVCRKNITMTLSVYLAQLSSSGGGSEDANGGGVADCSALPLDELPGRGESGAETGAVPSILGMGCQRDAIAADRTFKRNSCDCKTSMENWPAGSVCLEREDIS